MSDEDDTKVRPLHGLLFVLIVAGLFWWAVIRALVWVFS